MKGIRTLLNTPLSAHLTENEEGTKLEQCLRICESVIRYTNSSIKGTTEDELEVMMTRVINNWELIIEYITDIERVSYILAWDNEKVEWIKALVDLQLRLKRAYPVKEEK